MPIDPMPTAPNRLTQTQAEFSANASNIVDWMGDFAEELNSVSSTYYLSVSATSVTSNSIGTGSKSFTVQTGLGFVVGNSLRVAYDGTNYMTGDVSSYDGGTGALVVNVTSSTGTGTYTSWKISLAAVGASAASDISVTPAGNISSTNVQAALQELDSEKLSSADGAVVSAKLASVITGASVGSSFAIPVITFNDKGQITGTSTASTSPYNSTQASTSGSQLDFNSIPTSVTQVTVTLSGVSSSSTGLIYVRGKTAGGEITSGYGGASNSSGTSVATSTFTTGFFFRVTSTSSDVYHGSLTLTRQGTSNVWCAQGGVGLSNTSLSGTCFGSVDLGGNLTGIVVGVNSGSFDAGVVGVRAS